MDGILALDVWGVVMEVLHSRNNNTPPTQNNSANEGRAKGAAGNCMRIFKRQVDSRQEAQLYIFEDTEAVIKMIIEGRSPTMRHVSRTQKVVLDWLLDRVSLDPKIQITYVDTKNQLADLLTRASFTRDE